MKQFGLDESRVRSLVGAVSPGPPQDEAATADLFARAAWTSLTEPGDGMAGMLIGCLGASTALTAILESWPLEKLIGMLRDAGGDPEEDLGEKLDDGLQRWRNRLSSADVIHALEQCARSGGNLLVPGDRLWPAALDDLGPHAPIALWWRGVDNAWLALPNSIALVGARAATGYGEHVAMEAAAGLVDRGFAIVSGAAYGIDGMAHRSTLASGGLTLAFLAGGIDRFYPSGHDALLARIAEVGAVVSELPCGAAPTKWRFLQRNRLIAAASTATVVLEAGWRSGTLNTAGHAAALGRPLGAVPGPVTSPTSSGCHRLIREYDAICVTNAAEMAELVGSMTQVMFEFADDGAPQGAIGSGRTSEQVRVFDALSTRAPRPIPDIARRAGLSTGSVIGALGTLDMEGAVRRRESGWVRAR
ncbi:DNA-processing protein DprA [Leifsonia sp. YAF41]|uniref:DNA-processing protein DprA n=1 Tax=Leifsonia sp. YAF41 TaxID=3233086 RepID=UPI003F987E12